MSKYRIVKITHKDDSVKFKIEKNFGEAWLNITERETIVEAREAVIFLTGKEEVSSEVVE